MRVKNASSVLGLARLHGDELVLAGGQRRVDDQPVQLAARGRGAHLGGQKHQVGVDRARVERVEPALVAAGEAALDHVGDAQMAELAAGEVRPDHIHDRVELGFGRFVAEGLKQADLPQRHALSAPRLSLGRIEMVPVVPLEVMTSSGVCSSSRSIQSSMPLQPLVSTPDRS